MSDTEEHGINEPFRTMLFPGSNNEGNVSLLVSDDKLKLIGDFYPPLPGGKPLSPDQISEALVRLGIVHGILWENIQNAVTDCNINRKPLKDITMALGNPPVAEILEYFQVNPKLQPEISLPSGNERLDYRAISPFIIVKKDQALAKRKSHKEGRNGKDIYGYEIPHGIIRPESITAGENTRTDGIYIFSEINGQLVEEKKTLHVRDSLHIKGGVDYHTGNIIFPGDVLIDGHVSDGFKIYSGGSVTIKQTFDVTEVITKTDLKVAGGIIGRGRALVKVGGELKTKFIENCRVACRKAVIVETEIINSSVYTMEKIEMNEKGMILGSEIYAVRGIHTGGIGKKTGKASKIHCGVDFTAQQEQEKYNSQLRIIAAKMNTIRELLNQEDKERKKLEEALVQLEEQQSQITAKVSAVFARLYSDENAVVEVLGEIAPGTLVEICKIALFVTEPLKGIRIRLDRGLGRLVTEPLKNS